MQLLRLLRLPGGQADRALECQNRLIEIAAQLIRRAEVRGGAEVVRMVAVSGTQHGEGRVDRPYAQMQRAEVRSLLRRERSLRRGLRQFRGRLPVIVAERMR